MRTLRRHRPTLTITHSEVELLKCLQSSGKHNSNNNSQLNLTPCQLRVPVRPKYAQVAFYPAPHSDAFRGCNLMGVGGGDGKRGKNMAPISVITHWSVESSRKPERANTIRCDWEREGGSWRGETTRGFGDVGLRRQATGRGRQVRQ